MIFPHVDCPPKLKPRCPRGEVGQDWWLIFPICFRELPYNAIDHEHALARVPVDASRWTPKGETKGLSTLYIQKEYHFDVGDTVLVFLCAEGKNFDHPK